MQKIRPLILIAAMLVAGSATAASISITIDGTTNSYTLGSLGVDGTGNATVVASNGGSTSTYAVTINKSVPDGGGSINGSSTGTYSSGSILSLSASALPGFAFSGWGGDCSGTSLTCTKTVTGDMTLNVSATFTATDGNVDVLDGNCPEVDPTKVKVVDTSVSNGLYPRTDYSSVVPEHIHAFKFTTKNEADLGNWIATKLTVATSGKLVKITQCPGVLEATNTVGACERSTAESTRIDYTVNMPELGTRNYCQLQPNTVYYANVISKTYLTDTTYNCGTTATAATTKCGFSMSGE